MLIQVLLYVALGQPVPVQGLVSFGGVVQICDAAITNLRLNRIHFGSDVIKDSEDVA